MRRIGRVPALWPAARVAVVAVAVFMLGAVTAVQADMAGIPIGSLFSISQLNGTPTAPCTSITSPTGKVTTTCFAQVDAKGQLAVTDADTHKLLGTLQFDSNGNLKVSSSGTSTVTGTVSVNNFPATQDVSGTVSVGNLPATQPVSGTVSVGNLPATQPVSGTVNVGNLPLDGSGNVKVSGQSQATAPVATKGFRYQKNVPANQNQLNIPVNMSLTEVALIDCSEYLFFGPDGMILRLRPRDEPYVFPVAIPVTTAEILNFNVISSCNANIDATGY